MRLTGAGLSYFALSPENFPLSRKDPSGLRSVEKEVSFRLPDYRVDPVKGTSTETTAIGVGRQGDVGTLLRKALDSIGGRCL